MQVVDSIIKTGKCYSIATKSDSPLLWNWHDKVYFGAAHGMAGILYMLLQVILLGLYGTLFEKKDNNSKLLFIY